jgi:predicted metal-dependent hydrolase
VIAEPPEPRLSAEERVAFRKGVEEFNSGLFFECHDTLEELWSGVRGPSRGFFQGLIQVSVAFYHLTGGNPAGARSMLDRALRRFEGYPDRYFGLDLSAHRGELSLWRARIAHDEAAIPSREELPVWRFDEG